jgi:hypothetical protein
VGRLKLAYLEKGRTKTTRQLVSWCDSELQERLLWQGAWPWTVVWCVGCGVILCGRRRGRRRGKSHSTYAHNHWPVRKMMPVLLCRCHGQDVVVVPPTRLLCPPLCRRRKASSAAFFFPCPAAESHHPRPLSIP